MPAVLQIALLKIFRCAVGMCFVPNLYDFTRFRCAENRTPQDHFRCVMVYYRTQMPQKTRPEMHKLIQGVQECSIPKNAKF